MLQDIRANSQGTIAKIIIGLIVISFSIFGIESLLFSGGSSGVAEVNGEEITPFALQQELSVQQRQLLSLLGDDADPALLDQSVMSQRALETLIQREIVRQAAEGMDLSASDAVIGEIITSMEQFQIDGQFSRDLFQSSLAQAGFTPALFRDRLAEDLQVTQLRAGLAGSDFSTAKEIELAARIALEGRDVRYASIPVARFLGDREISDEAVQAYYEANAASYRSPEMLDLEYLELHLDDYREPVSEDRLEQEFELVRDEFEVPTETRVSHILFETDGEERLPAVLAALDGGMSFADAAAEYSDDFGSSSSGGDLGYTDGTAFPEAMEEAIASLAVDQRSGPVETDAGTHLILVTDRREGTEVTLADVRFELEDRIQRGDAREELLLDVERLRDLAFNAADLDGPAQEMGLTVASAQGIARSENDGLFADSRLVDAAFSEDVLEAGHNSEVLELDEEHFVVLRVAQRMPPAPLPLAEVEEEIREALRTAAARDAARAAAEDLFAALEAGQSMETAALEAGLEWQVELGAQRDSNRLPPSLRDRLFSLPAPEAGGPLLDVIEPGAFDPAGGSFYVMEFVRITSGRIDDLPAAQREELARRVAGETAGVLQQQFESALRERSEVVVY
jgi:peptidyl-prolyl cis-trans isomerase D